MFGSMSIDILCTKIVNNQGKSNRACFVLPKSGCLCYFIASTWGKMLFEEFVCQNSCLRKAIQAFLNFDRKKHVFGALVNCIA